MGKKKQKVNQSRKMDIELCEQLSQIEKESTEIAQNFYEEYCVKVLDNFFSSKIEEQDEIICLKVSSEPPTN